MKQFFVQLRVFRTRDQNYLTVRLRVYAGSLDHVADVVRAFGSGLMVAGAQDVILEALYADYPLGEPSPEEYKHVDGAELRLALQVFLGLKRDRRKAREDKILDEVRVTTESENPDEPNT